VVDQRLPDLEHGLAGVRGVLDEWRLGLYYELEQLVV
jgi:hypothetical protein